MRQWLKSVIAKSVSPAPVANFLCRAGFLGHLERWEKAHRCPEWPNRFVMYEKIINTCPLNGPITYLEFGVFQGETIQWWVDHNSHPDSRFVGFDSFRGLPEQWTTLPKGTFSTEGKPPAIPDSRCSFQVGWFQATLPGFLKDYSSPHRLVVHLDADLYSSTLYVLTMLAMKLKAGDVLIFDEFDCCNHEFRAFSDFVEAYGVRYELLGRVGYWKVAMRIL